MTVVAQRDLHAAFMQLGCAALQDAAPEYCVVLDPPPVARVPGRRLAAPVFPVRTANDMLPCLQALSMATPGEALFIVNVAAASHALIGDIFATAARQQRLAGVVVLGAVRDLDGLVAIGLPVFSTEVTYVSAKTATVKAVDLPHSIALDDCRPAFTAERLRGGVALERGDWVFGDSDGMLVVKRAHVSAVISAATVLQAREEHLKRVLQDGTRLSDVIGLDKFLAGEGDLKFSV